MILYPVNTSKYTIGGKAKGLVRLKAASIPVPDFLVVPAENFDTLINSYATGVDVIKKSLSSYSLSLSDKKTIVDILLKWNFPKASVVVRSSVADEDGSKHTFAGLMDSFINLTHIDDVFAAISACAASAYSARAIEYRKQKELQLRPRPAVIIQQQINADVSGVIFSTYPEYPQEMAIHAVWGFGEGLVSGQLQPDEFYLLKINGSLNRQHIADKQQQIAVNTLKGTTAKEVDEERTGIPCLTQQQLSKLYSLATRLEKEFGHPQDIEFVIEDDQTWIVQSRPITQAIPDVVVYDNSNIQESYCGVTTPLTFSFAQRAYATVYKQTMKVLALPNKVVQAHDEVVNNLLGLIKGRIYYNINNWYKGLLLLPSFKQNKEDMERMMGLQEPVDFVEGSIKTTSEKIKMLPSLAANFVRLLLAFNKLSKTIPAFHLHFLNQYKRFYKLHLEELTCPELIEQKQILDKELLNNWTIPIINDFYVMMTNGNVNRRLKKVGISDAEEFLSRYLSADQQIESAQPAIALQELAGKARASPELKKLIIELPNDIHAKVEQAFPGFHKDVNGFIDSYGDRTVGELKLETLTMRVDPITFYKYLRNFLSSTTTTLPGDSPSLRESAVKELEEKLSSQPLYLKKRVLKGLDKLQNAIRYREALRLERTRLFGMYRSLYLTLGNRLYSHNLLNSRRDVFYLTEEEIITLARKPIENIKALIEERKKEFEVYAQEEVPARVVIPSPPVTSAANQNNNPDKLSGTGCYPGTVSAEAIVVMGPESELNVSGKIVCALRTDPGWAALFPTCKGVLIEKGSALSHSVILLREFGIPTIINIQGLTKKIKSGQQITMNATTGEIQIAVNETAN